VEKIRDSVRGDDGFHHAGHVERIKARGKRRQNQSAENGASDWNPKRAQDVGQGRRWAFGFAPAEENENRAADAATGKAHLHPVKNRFDPEMLARLQTFAVNEIFGRNGGGDASLTPPTMAPSIPVKTIKLYSRQEVDCLPRRKKSMAEKIAATRSRAKMRAPKWVSMTPGAGQALKLSPQEQLLTAFGFLTLKPPS
jgi:hypothetical protein